MLAHLLPGIGILQRCRLPLVSAPLHPDGVVVAVDVYDVEMGHGGIALSLPTLRLHFLQIGPLRIRVNGQHFVRVKLVALSVGIRKDIKGLEVIPDCL